MTKRIIREFPNPIDIIGDFSLQICAPCVVKSPHAGGQNSSWANADFFGASFHPYVRLGFATRQNHKDNPKTIQKFTITKIVPFSNKTTYLLDLNLINLNLLDSNLLDSWMFPL